VQQKFMDPRTGATVDQPMGVERGMRGYGAPNKPAPAVTDKKPVAGKPAAKPHKGPARAKDTAVARPSPHVPPPAPGGPQPPVADTSPQYDGNWIQGAIKKPGALHSDLGVQQGEKIQKSKIAQAAKGSGKTAQRARLAETLSGLHHDGETSQASETKTPGPAPVDKSASARRPMPGPQPPQPAPAPPAPAPQPPVPMPPTPMPPSGIVSNGMQIGPKYDGPERRRG
jgi:hypothetical protein